jgi:hypothetical protein
MQKLLDKQQRRILPQVAARDTPKQQQSSSKVERMAHGALHKSLYVPHSHTSCRYEEPAMRIAWAQISPKTVHHASTCSKRLPNHYR